jgi:chromate transporter
VSLVLDIALTAFVLSMLAVGGAIAVVPELFRIAVETKGWLDAATFNELFAISQASPGPTVMIFALLGWKVAGPLAGVLAISAFVVPSSIIAVLVFRKLRTALSPARARAVQAALAPISCALVASSGVLIARNLEGAWIAWGIAAGAAAWATAARVHPLVPLAAGAAAGAVLL